MENARRIDEENTKVNPRAISRFPGCLMPITSDLRSWPPPEAMIAFTALIDEVSVGRAVRVIDLRQAMPDAAFADYAYLNPAGREVFSGIVAERLNDLKTEE
jgi:hypothetical protein